MDTVDLAEALRAAERRLQAAQLTSDVAAIDALMADEALFTDPAGALLTKRDDLRAHADGAVTVHRVEEEDLRVLVTGDTGVTWFLGAVDATVDGARFAARLRYTRTWTRDPRLGWRILAAHAVQVTGP